MTTVTFPIDAETDALLAMLRVPGSFGVYKAGDVYKAGATLTYPYAVLNRLPGGAPALPSLSGPGNGWRSLWQVDCVGLRQDQAEALAVWIAARWLAPDGVGGWANPIVLDGWSCLWRAPQPDLGTRAEGQPGKKLFVARRRLELVWA